MEIQKFLFDLFSKQKFSECLEQSRISLIKNPNCIISREFEAVSLLKLNKIQESKKAFLEILKINKNIYSAHLNLARIFSQEGNYKIADQFYKNALIIQKNNCDLMLEQARFYKKFNFSNHAKNVLFKINELNKNLPLVYFEIADIYYQEQNYERALTNYKLADNLLPDDAVVLNSIASCFFNLDQISQAEKFYTKALAIKPDLILTLSNLAYFYQSKGDFDKALNFLNKILEIDPNNTEAYRYLSLQHKFENKTDPVLIKMVKIYQDLVNLNEKMTIGFALSKAYEDLYMYEEVITLSEI